MARVLLVEDEPNIASIIVFKLEREGHQVRWESSASTVLDAAAATAPDLVLLDSSLPDGARAFPESAGGDDDRVPR